MQTELIELVLKGKLKDPLARTFHPDAWRKEIEKIKTDEAQKLYENAILVRDYADAILRKLDTTIYKTAPASQMVNSLIAWANSLAFEFRRKHREQIAVAGKNTLSVFPRVTLAGGNQFNIADANTSLIDSLRLPLSDLIGQLNRSSEFSAPTFVDDTESVSSLLNLASAWHILNFLWKKCLFFDYRLVENADRISLNGEFDFSYFTVGRARQMHDNGASFAARTYVKKQQSKKEFRNHQKDSELI